MLGTPAQYTAFDPNTVNFVIQEQQYFFGYFDTDKANALLDEMGLVDGDGDRIRDRIDPRIGF